MTSWRVVGVLTLIPSLDHEQFAGIEGTKSVQVDPGISYVARGKHIVISDDKGSVRIWDSMNKNAHKDASGYFVCTRVAIASEILGKTPCGKVIKPSSATQAGCPIREETLSCFASVTPGVVGKRRNRDFPSEHAC